MSEQVSLGQSDFDNFKLTLVNKFMKEY